MEGQAGVLPGYLDWRDRTREVLETAAIVVEEGLGVKGLAAGSARLPKSGSGSSWNRRTLADSSRVSDTAVTSMPAGADKPPCP